MAVSAGSQPDKSWLKASAFLNMIDIVLAWSTVQPLMSWLKLDAPRNRLPMPCTEPYCISWLPA